MTPWFQDAFHHPESAAYQRVQPVIWALIAMSILLFGVELSMGPARPVWLDTVDLILLVVFALELVLRVATWHPPILDIMEQTTRIKIRGHIWGRLAYLFRPLNLVDLLTVLALVPALRGLRALRLLRLLRGTSLFRYSSPMRGTLRAFEDNALLYAGAFSLIGAQMVLGGVSLYLVERGTNDGLSTIGDGIWWALVTITTVGFGDIAPVTVVGRVIASVLMVGGMFTLALFAGLIGHSLLNAVLSVREEQFRMTTTVNHIVICGYDRGARLLIDALLAEVDAEQTPIVLFAPGERPTDIPPALRWINGDPAKESELSKARLTHARAAIIVGSRDSSPQEADAVTILTCFTIRSWLRKQAVSERRKQPLYVVAEVLDSENVAHTRAAGADEVIETPRLGFSLLAHAINMPGTAQLMSDVANVGAHSLYVGNPGAIGASETFESLAVRLKEAHGLMLIGLRDSRTGEDEINPPSDFAISPAHRAIYLAEGVVLPLDESPRA